MYTNLFTHIRKYVSLDDSEERLLSTYLRHRQVGKKYFLLKEGQICHARYFILNGCFRYYFVDNAGIDQIIQFGIENWWISDYISLADQKPSLYYIQAIENSETAFIEKQVEEELFAQIPQLDRYFRFVFQRAYSASLQRIQYILKFTGEEKYDHFNKNFPEFVQRVPQYMLASFLGFTPEFLSKIRAKKK